MRNRANTTPRNENDFINGGSAGVGMPKVKPAKSKTQPVTVSLNQEVLDSMDAHRQNAALTGLVGVSRTDIVRAAMMALNALPEDKAAEIIRAVKGK